MDAVKRHSRSTCPVSKRPLHAGTQEKRVRGGKTRSSTTHTKETNCGREKHRQGPRPGRQLHTSPLTHTDTIAAPSVCGRKDSALHTTISHKKQAVIHQWTRTRSDTPPPPPVQSHGQRDTATARCQQTQRTRSEQSPKEPNAEADPHPSMTRCLTPRGHTERTVSSTEIIRRQSLKNASVSDGPSNTIEENGQCGNAVTAPATMIPPYRGNSPITPRMHTQSTYHIKITQCFSPETKQPHSLPNSFGHR
ncbi:hypothetical protein TCDM_13026 [Trypanosoma cruzi Dm28c]|uniref:Uncharacterized protein n=1 Tax=Trypanosoma cruzi Dm28c TaxID=1416333 RepID=V5A3Y5_TRYCR|nr:hypothetical protein TCDM_13026 [Trypanosoma cruzi Dm28c]